MNKTRAKSKVKLVMVGAGVICALVLGLLGIELEPREIPWEPPPNDREIRYHNVHLRRYRSSQDPEIRLWALVHLPPRPACILVTSHGWHGDLSMPGKDYWWRNYLHMFEKNDHSRECLTVEVDMRGRAFSDGRPDANGWELQDWVDAVEFVREEYGEYISDPECVYVEGGSGAGGNVYALLGKFPDYFAAAAVHAGMSDYALLYHQDETGEFIDEMDGEGWIGGSPDTNPDGYRSRGGLTTVGNLLTPIHIDHGETDVRVPVAHARRYVAAARSLGRAVRYIEWPSVGDRRHWANMTEAQYHKLESSIRDWFSRYRRQPTLPKKGRLTVAGYLKTRLFQVILEHVNRVGTIKYDVDPEHTQWRFYIAAPTSSNATLRVRWPEDRPVNVQTRCKEATVYRDESGAWVQVELVLTESEAEVTLH